MSTSLWLTHFSYKTTSVARCLRGFCMSVSNPPTTFQIWTWTIPWWICLRASDHDPVKRATSSSTSAFRRDGLTLSLGTLWYDAESMTAGWYEVLLLKSCLWSVLNMYGYYGLQTHLWFVCPEHTIPKGLVFAYMCTGNHVLFGQQVLCPGPVMKCSRYYYYYYYYYFLPSTGLLSGWICWGDRSWTN